MHMHTYCIYLYIFLYISVYIYTIYIQYIYIILYIFIYIILYICVYAQQTVVSQCHRLVLLRGVLGRPAFCGDSSKEWSRSEQRCQPSELMLKRPLDQWILVVWTSPSVIGKTSIFYGPFSILLNYQRVMVISWNCWVMVSLLIYS